MPYFDDFDVMGALSVDANRTTFHINTYKKYGALSLKDWSLRKRSHVRLD